MDNPCVCGHIWDEHVWETKECMMEGCGCLNYEEED